MTTEPRIYVACLASYNAGHLFGEWIDCDGLDSEDLGTKVKAILDKSPIQGAEEYAIHDHEGFHGLIGENSNMDEVAEIVELMSEHDDGQIEAAASFSSDLEDIRDAVTDRYAGSWSSKEDWAEQYLNDTGQLDNLAENLKYYFNYEAFARDCELSGDMSFAEDSSGNVHAFNAC